MVHERFAPKRFFFSCCFWDRTLSESADRLETASNRRWPGERFRRRRPGAAVRVGVVCLAGSGGDPRRATPGLARAATDFNSVTTSIEHCGFDSIS
jgi:hypothetical protein